MALTVPPATTGYSGFWNSVGTGTGNYALRYARSSHEYRAGVMLARRGFRKYKAQFRALVGVAPGATATDTRRRVASADPAMLGGLRATEVVNQDSTTTAGMVTAIQARVFDQFSTSMTYPVDRSGNGGGGKRGR